MRYFGEAWDAPGMSNAVQVRTPVGWSCFWCGLPIVESDRGYSLPYVSHDDVIGEVTISKDYVHRECYFAERLGHLVGVCGCAGYYPTRTAAVLAWRRWELVKDDPPW